MRRDAKDLFDLFDNPSAMLRWIEQPEGMIFLGYIESMLELSREHLERDTEMVEIYRRQGRAEVLRGIHSLPEEFRQAIKQKAVKNGMVR